MVEGVPKVSAIDPQLLAIFDLVDPVTEHAIYVCGDLVAKYLLLFVYVAAIK